MEETTERIVSVIKAIPYGQVATYGGVARAAGIPNGARQVARILHALSAKEKLPWHRVVRADGSVALAEGSGKELQIALLRSEGVQVDKNNRINIARLEK